MDQRLLSFPFLSFILMLLKKKSCPQSLLLTLQSSDSNSISLLVTFEENNFIFRLTCQIETSICPWSIIGSYLRSTDYGDKEKKKQTMKRVRPDR